MSRFHSPRGRGVQLELLPVIPEDVELEVTDIEEFEGLVGAASSFESLSTLEKEVKAAKFPPRFPSRSCKRYSTQANCKEAADIPQLVNWYLDTYPQDLGLELASF